MAESTETISSIITDLTGTVWYFNEVLEQIQESFYYNINFTSNNISYIKISWSYSSIPQASMTLKYSPNINSDTTVYNDGVGVIFDYWDNLETYRTISITGGADATNSNLISWLQDNATLLSAPASSSYSAADPLVIRYKGQIIYSTSSTSPITLAVSGKYLEDDITVTLNPPFTEQDNNTLNIQGTYTASKFGTVLTLT